MEQIIFEVQGSEAEPYRVTFTRRSESNFSAYCTCAAGSNGQYCKHRFSILGGLVDGVVSANIQDISTIQSWLPGTDVHTALLRVAELEERAAQIKKELTAAKKAVAAAMRD